MAELLTSAQMRGIEAAAIESGAATGAALMERAGRGVVQKILTVWPELAAAPHRAAVLCGPGNNGGDGYVVARLLAEWGWQVSVYALGDPARLPPDARANHDRWAALGPVRPMDEAPGENAEVIVDALFGTGLARPVAPDLVMRARAGQGARVVAVDLPSGLCGDSGRALGGAAVRADLTVTFHAPKLGHYLSEGPAHCARVVVHDIGLRGGAGDAAVLVEGPGVDLAKDPARHKYGHGHALVLAGGPGRGGAARLAAQGALRVGAGLVTLACPPAAMPENAAQLTAVMLRPLADADAMARLLEDRRLNALCLGPALGLDERARALVACALTSERAVVLDADALTAFAGEPDALLALTRAAPATVLTPHPGEFARLFPGLAADLDAPPRQGPAVSRVDVARAAAARAGCVVLLKGPDTVIAAPGGRVAVHAAVYDRAAPWLATAGAGDVLAGLIAGLMARGCAPFDAAAAGAWLHAEAARGFGPGLIAEDLPGELPRVFRSLGL